MTFIIMHKTSALWESGALPAPELVARVGAFIGELAATGILRAGEGLRASAEGVRLIVSGGTPTIVRGPFAGGNELPAAFDIVRARSIDDAVAWAARQAEVLGDVEIDVRPVTEAWDIGLAPRPADATERRYMVLRKANAASEAGRLPDAGQRASLSRLIAETTAVEHLAAVAMRPSGRGRRLLNAAEGIAVYDGPFVESKELLAGFIIVSAASLDEATALARRYLTVVDAGEVDLREIE